MQRSTQPERTRSYQSQSPSDTRSDDHRGPFRNLPPRRPTKEPRAGEKGAGSQSGLHQESQRLSMLGGIRPPGVPNRSIPMPKSGWFRADADPILPYHPAKPIRPGPRIGNKGRRLQARIGWQLISIDRTIKTRRPIRIFHRILDAP